MENSAKCKMYHVGAFLLEIGETMLISFGHGNLPISGLVLFGIF